MNHCPSWFAISYIYSADIGMVQSGRGPRLATEAVEDLRVFGDFIRQKFQRRKATEHGVLGLVDHAHPAAAQLLDNAVMRDGLPNHAIGRC